MTSVRVSQFLAPAELVSVEPMPLHYEDIEDQPYL